jgi:hypothetical protein
MRKHLILSTLLLVLSFQIGFAEDEQKSPCPPAQAATPDGSLKKFYQEVKRGLNSYLLNSPELKSFDKLEDYIDSQCKGRFSKHGFAEKIQIASDKFSVPLHLIACTIMQESHFESGVKDSPTGAKGLMQWEEDARKAFNLKLQTDKDFKNEWISAGWKNKSGLAKEITANDLKTDVSLMISATAIRMKYDSKALFGEALGTEWTVDQMKVLVAQYNLGPGGLHRRCGDLKNSDPKNCINTLERLKGAFLPGTKKHADEKASQAWYEMDGAAQCMLAKP